MRLVRAGLAIVALTGGALALPASAHMSAPPALGGVTTVVATHSGSVKVALYDDATMSARVDGNPDVSLRGKGRFVGVWLSRVDNPSPPYGFGDFLTIDRAPSFIGGKLETYGSTGPGETCTPWPNATVPVRWDCTGGTTAPDHITLHQGYYMLTVLTDGSPLRVTLHLHGARGRARVSPATNLRTVEAPLTARDSIGSTMVTWGASQSGFSSDTTSTLQFVTAKVPAGSNASGSSSCTRNDDGSGYQYPYGPMCPNGTTGGGWYQYTVGSYGLYGGWVFGTSGETPSGVIGQGGAVWSNQGVSFGQGLGVWIAGPPM